MTQVVSRRSNGTLRVQTVVEGPSRTKQAFKQECDINRIVRRWKADGVLTHVNRFKGNYGDFTGIPDYRECLDKVMYADEMFSTLPAAIRKRFDNDPANFIDFVDNPQNRDQMIEMGLIQKPVIHDSSVEDSRIAKPRSRATKDESNSSSTTE